ncbi:hypothetical protein [Phenylobacterium sp. J367]|uniref:hypothetical protein n=1 Tax=Phenylobacterium sp. J367 TaxID=2898435 RepID=UPI002151EB9D|nr:hypothetical protein [Phenylobacterium sp. J367]MCR5877831.1 hypothetical protein [Phenylobacterium sp. J367]
MKRGSASRWAWIGALGGVFFIAAAAILFNFFNEILSAIIIFGGAVGIILARAYDQGV